MQSQDYHSSITAHCTPQEALNKISHVWEWWAKNFEGKSERPDDVFTARFEGGDMYKVQVSEVVPNKKVTWKVIDSYQGWHDDHTEWIGTHIVWEIIPETEGISVKMTHVGLVPAFECFNQCQQGWDYLIKKSLFDLLNKNKGLPV